VEPSPLRVLLVKPLRHDDRFVPLRLLKAGLRAFDVRGAG
jgi:hypothetical protein